MTEEKPVETRENKIERDAKGRLLPGSTANRNGRPKGSFGLADILKRKMAEVPMGQMKSYAELFIETLLNKAYVEGDSKSMQLVMNYCDGLPRATIGLDGGEEGEPIAISVETAGIVNEALSKFLGVVPTEEENEVDADGEAPVVEAPVVE